MSANTNAQQSATIPQLAAKSKNPKPNPKYLFIAFFTGIISSIFIQRYICQNWRHIAPHVFSVALINTHSDKLTVLKESLLYMAVLEFILTMSIMSIRIFGQWISPVGEKDPLVIAVINRILANNIEQAVAFFGVYSYILFST